MLVCWEEQTGNWVLRKRRKLFLKEHQNSSGPHDPIHVSNLLRCLWQLGQTHSMLAGVRMEPTVWSVAASVHLSSWATHLEVSCCATRLKLKILYILKSSRTWPDAPCWFPCSGLDQFITFKHWPWRKTNLSLSIFTWGRAIRRHCILWQYWIPAWFWSAKRFNGIEAKTNAPLWKTKIFFYDRSRFLKLISVIQKNWIILNT